MTVKGLAFTGMNAVSFGGVSSSSFTVIDDTTMTAVVGSGASGFVKVISSGGSDSLAGFLYTTSSQYSVAGRVISPSTTTYKLITGVKIGITGGNSVLSAAGVYGINNLSSGNYTLKATKNNDINKANGVTAVDIALTQGHILAKNIFNSPYKIIAADVTGDGKVTTLDIVYMKRLILGIDTTFTNSVSKQTRLWAFVDSSYKFTDTTNPFPFKDSISYTGLSANKTNQTFIGCKLGDVNWDWNPAIAKRDNNLSDAIELSYTMNEVNITSDPYIHIPVKVKNFKAMLGIQFTINFNADLLQWKGISNNPLGIETGTNHAAEGSVSFLWVDPKNEIKTLEDGSVLFELLFKKIDNGQHSMDNGQLTMDNLNTNTISVDGSVTAVAAYDKDYGVHNVVMNRVENIQPLQAESWSVAPNPVTDGLIHIQMNLKDKKIIVFRLSDNTGRVLLSKKSEGIKGANQFTINKTKNIPAGVYYLQATGVEGVKQLIISY